MDPVRLEWHPAKAAANARKHGVSFDEAETAFLDDHALVLDDPDHAAAAGEDRSLLLGLSTGLRLLLVVHCYRERDSVIRIISARKATRSERAQYGARCKP